MPTMADVAKHANVSLSTVSYAINGTRPISEETRKRVFASMETLGYRPNALARGLASKRSHILALLFSAPERGLGITEMEFVTGAVEAARENDYHLILWSSEMHGPEELRRAIQQGLVDGVIVMEVHEQDMRINLLRDIGLPFTLIGRCADSTGISFVDIDFRQTIGETVDYLASLDHHSIAFMNQSQTEYDAGYGPAVRTHACFAESIAVRNLKGCSRLCPSTPIEGYEVFEDLIAECPEISALITMNERAIPGLLQGVADQGWRIPDDFSIVAVVTSARAAEMTVPSLTTMDPPSAKLARIGVELLIQQLEEPGSPPQQILLPCRLIVRGSSGPCRRNPESAKG